MIGPGRTKRTSNKTHPRDFTFETLFAPFEGYLALGSTNGQTSKVILRLFVSLYLKLMTLLPVLVFHLYSLSIAEFNIADIKTFNSKVVADVTATLLLSRNAATRRAISLAPA